MLWVVVDVTSRALGSSWIVGTPAVAADSVVGITFLCIPYAIRSGGSVRSRLIAKRLPAAVQRVLYASGYVIGAAMFALIAWSSWDPLIASYRSGEYAGEGALVIVTWPLRALIVGSALLAALECTLTALSSEKELASD